jgi:hypothetical protein
VIEIPSHPWDQHRVIDPGFVPQVRPRDCSISALTKAVGVEGADTYAIVEEKTKGLVTQSGLGRNNVAGAIRAAGGEPTPVMQIPSGSRTTVIAERLNEGDTLFVVRNNPDGTGHAMVVTRYDPVSNTLSIHDPANGSFANVPAHELFPQLDWQHSFLVRKARGG